MGSVGVADARRPPGPISSRRNAALAGPHWAHLCSLMPLYRSVAAVTVESGQITAF